MNIVAFNRYFRLYSSARNPRRLEQFEAGAGDCKILYFLLISRNWPLNQGTILENNIFSLNTLIFLAVDWGKNSLLVDNKPFNSSLIFYRSLCSSLVGIFKSIYKELLPIFKIQSARGTIRTDARFWVF